MKKEMFHVIRQTLRSAYLSMMGTFAKPAVIDPKTSPAP